MELSKLYAITDRKLIRRSLGEDIADAVRGGAGLIQLREKNVTEEEYIAYAKEALKACRDTGAKLIINDSISVCAAAGADGVHLGQGDASPREARRILGDGAIIGVTAKTVEQARQAEADGADYLGSGAVFGTSTKADAVKMDIATLREIAAAVSIPVYAIGGINAENISLLRGSGVYGAAVVSGIFRGDIEKNAALLKKEAELL